MILFVMLFGVLAAALAAEASRRAALHQAAREESEALAARLAQAQAASAPVSVRLFECRRENLGLLWFVTFTIRETTSEVIRASSGLPHCPRCVAPLKLTAPARGQEEWLCVGCDSRHPGVNADLWTTDALLTACLREFFARHEEFSPAMGLSAPKFEAPICRIAPLIEEAERVSSYA
jgi:hypothetical protein